MRNTVLASRYARALFGLAKEAGQQDAIFSQMRVFEEAFSQDSQVREFLNSPLVRPSEKVKIIEKLTQSLNIPDILKNFLLLLGKKDRLSIFSEVRTAYQDIADENHGVTRGVVRSATVLTPEERQRIEEFVGRATKKQVILTYKEDPSLLGGLVANVGSLTFDDSLSAHLNRINEQINRSVH